MTDYKPRHDAAASTTGPFVYGVGDTGADQRAAVRDRIESLRLLAIELARRRMAARMAER